MNMDGEHHHHFAENDILVFALSSMVCFIAGMEHF